MKLELSSDCSNLPITMQQMTKAELLRFRRL